MLICSGCYLLYIASSDVLKDKFHTKVDKLTRFLLCCCFTRGHSSLIPTRGDKEQAVSVSSRAFYLWGVTQFCPRIFRVLTQIPCRLEKWQQSFVVFVLIGVWKLCSAPIHVRDKLSPWGKKEKKKNAQRNSSKHSRSIIHFSGVNQYSDSNFHQNLSARVHFPTARLTGSCSLVCMYYSSLLLSSLQALVNAENIL